MENPGCQGQKSKLRGVGKGHEGVSASRKDTSAARLQSQMEPRDNCRPGTHWLFSHICFPTCTRITVLATENMLKAFPNSSPLQGLCLLFCSSPDARAPVMRSDIPQKDAEHISMDYFTVFYWLNPLSKVKRKKRLISSIWAGPNQPHSSQSHNQRVASLSTGKRILQDMEQLGRILSNKMGLKALSLELSIGFT